MMIKKSFLSLVGMLVMIIAFILPTELPVFAVSDPGTYTFDISEGDITVSAGTNPDTVKVIYGDDGSGGQYNLDNIPSDPGITITGTTSSKKVTIDGVTTIVMLNNVDIQLTADGTCAFELINNANVTLTLNTETFNILKSGKSSAGVQVVSTTEISIKGTGSLEVTGGLYAAGIGGANCGEAGTINIHDGTINATGGNLGVGIGTGYRGVGGTINIYGGTVTATSGEDGAGIGGGKFSTGGIVNINGGTVTATGGEQGAGIGGGKSSTGGIVNINGGTVNATGGSEGAGIGGGCYGEAGIINIDGGVVNATGSSYGAGIGGGKGKGGGTITILKGTVNIFTGSNAAGIGGGGNGAGGSINIKGGTVNVSKIIEESYAMGAGIGGGDGTLGEGGSISITGGTVNVIGVRYGAGIGGGRNGQGGNVSITGGTVTAIGSYGAGIGGGYDSTGANVSITGGTVTAMGDSTAIGGSRGTGSVRIDSPAVIKAYSNLWNPAIATSSGKLDDTSTATILMAEFTTTQTANSNTDIFVKNIDSAIISFAPTEDYQSLAFTVPEDQVYQIKAGNVLQQHSISPSTDFTISSGGGLTTFTDVTDDINIAKEMEVAADKAALLDTTIKGENADLANITGPLTNPLPAVGSVNGSTITWASNAPGVVSNDGQTVVRPAYGAGNAIVTLTATLTKGTVMDTKAFTLTVLAETLDPDIGEVAADKGALLYTTIKGENADLLNITGPLTNPLLAVGSVNGSTITWASNTPGVVSNDGQTVVRPAFGAANATVILTATIKKGTVTDTKAFTLTVLAETLDPDIGKVAADKTALLESTIKGANADLANITGSLTNPLPAAGSVNGSTITWASNTPGVVSNDGQTVVRPDFGAANATVILTATLRKETVTDTKAFTLTVLAETLDPDIGKVAADKGALLDTTIKGENVDLLNITGPLTNPLLAVGSVNGSTITWASNIPEVVSNDGQTVVRPAFGAGNATVILTATLTKGTVTDTKTFTLTVLETPHVPHSSTEQDNQPQKGADILVNGIVVNVGTTEETVEDGKKTTIVSIDEKKLEQKLIEQGIDAIITIPVNTDLDTLIGELNGQMTKSMEDKQATIEIKTLAATYSLPAGQINIDAVSEQIGENVELKDIKVQIEISNPTQETAKIVENSAKVGEFTVIAPPVEFNISCAYSDKKVDVSQFDAYVERTVAIPEGIDPTKITTGVIIDADGTVRHVPTQIIIIDGKYYAKINSLTNSTYSVIWHPIEFKDVENHWAMDAVNDMGSRMVISGKGNDLFEPDRDITRAEFAAIVVRSLGLKPEIGNNTFTDVDSTQWYAGYIETAFKYGILSGYGDGKFGPLDKITREQAMKMIANAMVITELEMDFEEDKTEMLLASFWDFEQVSLWAKESMAACVKADIVSGKSGQTLAPKNEITRAEVAVIIQRLLQKSGLI